MNSKILNLLMICRKAGKLILGFDSAKDAVLSGNAKCIVLTCDISEKTMENIEFQCRRKDIPVLKTELAMKDIYEKLGRKSGILAVCDKGFAAAAQKAISNLPQQNLQKQMPFSSGN